jgi:hypothetical protein
MIVATALTILTLIDFVALMWGLHSLSKLEKRILKLEEEKENEQA